MIQNSVIIELLEEIKKTGKDTEKQVKALKQASDYNKCNDSDPEIMHLLKQVQEDVHLRMTEGNKWFKLIIEALHSMSKSFIHYHKIDFDFSRRFFIMIIQAVGFLVVLILLFVQLNDNKQLKDNDLKYRYILMENGIDSQTLLILEDAFREKKNDAQIKQIRKDVETYEKAVVESAKRLERARRKEEQAKKLQNEIEELRQND